MSNLSQTDSNKIYGRILVVDDNHANLLVATGTLDYLGFHYDTARDGTGAVELFSKQKYAVVLMDFQMPDMDGVEAMQQIRSYELRNSKERTPIIVITADINFRDNKARYSNNIDAIITKPYTFERLAEAIKSQCAVLEFAK